VTPNGRRDSYHQLLRRFSDARHDYDTPLTQARARRLVDLYPPAVAPG
jgi:hypothetical protein